MAKPGQLSREEMFETLNCWKKHNKAEYMCQYLKNSYASAKKSLMEVAAEIIVRKYVVVSSVEQIEPLSWLMKTLDLDLKLIPFYQLNQQEVGQIKQAISRRRMHFTIDPSVSELSSLVESFTKRYFNNSKLKNELSMAIGRKNKAFEELDASHRRLTKYEYLVVSSLEEVEVLGNAAKTNSWSYTIKVEDDVDEERREALEGAILQKNCKYIKSSKVKEEMV